MKPMGEASFLGIIRYLWSSKVLNSGYVSEALELFKKADARTYCRLFELESVKVRPQREYILEVS